MAVTAEIHDALDLTKLRLPSSIPVEQIDVEDYVDMDGEPALRIEVIIAESTDLEQISGRDVGELKSSIHASLRQHGIRLFPYIFIAKPSEMGDDESEED